MEQIPRIVVCDDDINIHKRVYDLLLAYNRQHPQEQMYFNSFADGESLMGYSDSIDLLFLDIELGEKSGIDMVPMMQQKHPDILVLDLVLAKIDGIQVMEQLQSDERLAQIPVIFLTADNDPETETRCFASGAVDFVKKPFLIGKIRNWIFQVKTARFIKKSKFTINVFYSARRYFLFNWYYFL